MAEGDEDFTNLNRLRRLIDQLDERGLILSLSAFAEDALGDLLFAFMQPGEAAQSLIKGFNAPLGTLSSRLKAAFALGLLNDVQHGNLDRLRRIRNVFAHSWEPLTFSDARIASHVDALKYIPLADGFPANRNEKLKSIISALLVEIRVTTLQLPKSGEQSRLISRHLIPGLNDGTPDPIGEIDRYLREIDEELGTTKGDRRNYLLSQRDRWLGVLSIMRPTLNSADRSAADEVTSRFRSR